MSSSRTSCLSPKPSPGWNIFVPTKLVHVADKKCRSNFAFSQSIINLWDIFFIPCKAQIIWRRQASWPISLLQRCTGCSSTFHGYRYDAKDDTDWKRNGNNCICFPVFRAGNSGFSEGRDRDGCLRVYKKPEIDKSTIGRSKQNVFS